MRTKAEITPVDAEAPPPLLPRPALFIDLDGVLAPIAPRPDAVGPDERRTRLLKALASRLDGRVAVVSGRAVADIDRICEGAVVAVAGVHGLERRSADGSWATHEPAAGLSDARLAFQAFAASHPAVLFEDKGTAIGLHYRQAPQAQAEAVELAVKLAAACDLTFQPGKMIAELKTPGASKGSALRAFMAEAPFEGATPVMLGDDLTDEHGFEAAATLGGFGVLVGPPRQTAARYGLADVDAVLAWLDAVEARA